MAQQPRRREQVLQAKAAVSEAIAAMKPFDRFACTTPMIMQDRHIGHIFDRDAKLKAMAEVKGYLSAGNSSGVHVLSAGSAQPEHGEQESRVQTPGSKASVRAYLDANPDARQLSINQVLSLLHDRGIRTSRTTVAEVLREGRKSA